MDLFEVIKSRRAVRMYKPDPVKRDVLMKIFEAGNWAPSGMNRQQWEVLVVTGEKKEQMGQSYGKIGESYAADWESSARDSFLQYSRTYGGAPLILVILTDASDNDAIRKMNIESASASLENIMLAARALGLGTCWMTGPLQDEKNLRQILDIPAEKEIVAITPLGYPVEFPEAPARIDPDLSHKVRWVE
jgi:nitroreductase